MGDTRPSHHANSSASSFKNPWVQSKSLLESGQGLFYNFPLTLAKRLHDHPAVPVKVIEPDWGNDEPDEGRVKATWLGHAVSQNGTLAQNDEPQWLPQGFLVQLPASGDPPAQPTRIVFDPIWSLRASPSSIAGPKRRLQPPCKLNQLPEFHFVVTSHNQSATQQPPSP
jgi:N-acyl-phosphatidylethanolamine-hydrolysing phospholipase D